jgi:electron transport complex protein RnfG
MNDEAKAKTKPAATGGDSTSSFRMIATMGGLGLLCGVLIVATFQSTFSIIKENRRIALEKAIFEVVPGAVERTTFALIDGKLEALEGEEDAGVKYYACYDGDKELVGVAVEASGQGFQDVVRVLYGYSPTKEALVGLKVLESKETPGLGDKIESDPDFRANFEALSVELQSDMTSISNPIVLVKEGKKTDPWQIEAITGATVSSRAVATLLKKSTAVSVPVIVQNLPALKGEAR